MNYVKAIIFIALILGVMPLGSFAQSCGNLVINPITGLLDCAGGAGGGSGTVTNLVGSNGVGTSSGAAVTVTGTFWADWSRNAQTGTSYTIVTGDRGKIVTASNGSAIAFSIAQAGTTGFEAGWLSVVKNIGAGTVTITPGGGSLIDGAATIALLTGEWALISSNGTDYETVNNKAIAGSNMTITAARTGKTFAASSSATAFSDLTDCKVTVATNVATMAAPCRIRSGSVVFAVTTSATATLSGTGATSTVKFGWVPGSALPYASESAATTLTCNAFCTADTSGTFLAGSIPIAEVDFSGTTFSTITEYRAALQANIVESSDVCVTVAENGTTGVKGVSLETTNCVTTKPVLQSGAPLRCNSTTGSMTYTCGMTPALTAYTSGMVVEFVCATTALTGAASLNIDSLGVKNIKKSDGSTDPATGDCTAGQQVPLRYDGTVFRLPPSSSSASGKAVMYFPISIGGNNSGGSTYIGVNSAYTGCTGAASDISNAGGIGQVDLDFADAATNCAGFNLLIPNEWDAGTVTLSFSWWAHSGGSNGQVVVWNVETGCVGDNASAVSGPTYNTAQAVNSTATNASAGVEQKERITSLTMTGCSVNNRLWVKISRIGADGSDTFAGTAALSGLGLRMLADLQ